MTLPAIALVLLPALQQDPVAEEARKDLHAWYADRKLDQPYRKPLRELASDDPAQRIWASAYLVALFKRTVYDEEHGLTPETRGYKMGGGPQDDAAEMRHHAAEALAEATFHEDGRDALAPALYLFKEDPYEPNQVPAIKAIAKIRTLEASNLLRDAVLEPHPAFQVLIAAIKESAARKLHGLDDSFRKLANHYHSGVRTAARDAVRDLKLGDVAEVAPGDRLTATLEKGLRLLAQLPFESLPADAPWKWLKETTPYPNSKPWIVETQGWILKTTDKEIQVLLLDGTFRAFDKDKTVTKDGTLKKFADRVIALRARLRDEKDTDAEEELDEILGNRSFMNMKGEKEPTLAEGMMAAWLLVRGDRDAAAGLVVPLLEEYEHERGMLEGFRDLLAINLDSRMLDDFSDRRYDKALELARHLSGEKFKGWYRQDRARDLAEQLPRRMGVDFVTLTLPTLEEWPALSAKFSRKEKIAYLVERLRLIYAVQNSIPGGVDFGEDQSRHVPAAGDKKEQWIDLINPYVELYRMNLASNELALLMPALETSDYILAYNLQRFMPNNPISLFRVRWLAESLFNTCAQKEVIDSSILESGDRAKIKAHLAEAAAWCAKEGDLTLGGRLVRDIVEAADWEKVKSAVVMLDGLDRAALGPAVEKRILKDAGNRAQLYMVASQAGAGPAVVEQARRDLEKDAAGWAALVVAKYGDRAKKEGIASLAKAVRTGEPSLQDAAVDVLLESGDAGAEGALLSLLEPGCETKTTILVVQRLFERGRAEARDFLLAVVDEKREVQLTNPWTPSKFLLWELDRWSEDYPDTPKVEGRSDDDHDKARRETAKKWINATFDRIRKGERVKLKRLEPRSPIRDWSEGLRWIRRL